MRHGVAEGEAIHRGLSFTKKAREYKFTSGAMKF